MTEDRLRGPIIVLLMLVVIGSVGFHYLEDWSYLDSAYMTVVTLTTVGFGDYHPTTATSKWFTMFIIVAGVGLAALMFRNLYAALVSDEARRKWKDRRRGRMIDRLEKHVIICGFGQMGRVVASNIRDEKIPFVVVDHGEDTVALAEDSGFIALHGNASNEQVLREAGIERARALIIAVDSDAESVFIVLTARFLSTDVQIVARANREDSKPKLMRAGADRVILPYALSGQRMVSIVSRPCVTEFLDVVMRSGDIEWRIDEVVIPTGSRLAGKSLGEIGARKEFGVTVLAIFRRDGPVLTSPAATDMIEEECRIIALGTIDGLSAFANNVSA